MAKYLRYMGEFLSHASIVWRVEILQYADAPFEKIGPLVFDADEALVIEWNHAEKEEAVCGSTATLRVISPGDRTYEDLYTEEPGSIRLDVYREGELYWSGGLDAEFYEEPYERAEGYTVGLTFSDLGVLDRLKWDLEGMVTLREIADHCVARAGVNSVIDESLISTGLTDGDGGMGLDELKVRSENFYDEDGEAMTLKEVLEGVLQPLGLRVIQRAGRMWVHDLNGLYRRGVSVRAEWAGSSQTLGTDRVYNNARITWSPYVQGGDLTDGDCYTGETQEEETALALIDGRQVGDARVFTYQCTTEQPIDPYDLGFSIWLREEGKNVEIADRRARYYRIVPHYDGQESEGVALCWPGVGYLPGTVNTGFSTTFNGIPKEELALAAYPPKAGGVIFRTGEIEMPRIGDANRHGVRIAVEMLMDGRFNPFENAFVNWDPDHREWGQNHEWFVTWWVTYGNIVYMPVTLQYRDNETGKLYVWTNREYVSGSQSGVRHTDVPYLRLTTGKWVENLGSEEDPSDMGYLTYYQSEKRGDGAGAGISGWCRNRPGIPPTAGCLGLTVTKAQDGQYVPYPDFGREGGRMWMEVRLGGWTVVDVAEGMGFAAMLNAQAFARSVGDPHNFFRYNKFNWLLLKVPQIEVVNMGNLGKGLDTGDVEYSGVINARAKDDIELDTICGTSAEGVPLARGAYFRADTGEQVRELTRGGRRSQAEDLLIGTLFSQYGTRHVRLSGEMEIACGAWGTYSEACQGDRLFMITADSQDVIADTSEATLTELSPDEYEPRSGR